MLRNSARSAIKMFLDRFGYPTYTPKSGLARGLKVTGDLGFLQSGGSIVAEEQFLQTLDLESQTVYDIGAHIGIMSMFFSCAVGKAGKVIAFEPNPASCVWLHRNLDANNLRNVAVAEVGLGDKRETKTLIFDRYSRGAGSLDGAIQLQIETERGTRTSQAQIEVYTLDEYAEAHNLPKPDFIKIDVEGMEYNVLAGMSDILEIHTPALFIETHGADEQRKLQNAREVVDFLDSHAYAIYHVEMGRTVSPPTAHIAKGGHIYCTYAKRQSSQ